MYGQRWSGKVQDRQNVPPLPDTDQGHLQIRSPCVCLWRRSCLTHTDGPDVKTPRGVTLARVSKHYKSPQVSDPFVRSVLVVQYVSQVDPVLEKWHPISPPKYRKLLRVVLCWYYEAEDSNTLSYQKYLVVQYGIWKGGRVVLEQDRPVQTRLH